MWFGGGHLGNQMPILRPYLPIGPNGMKKQVYLVAFIDDATRFVLHAAFYPTLDSRIIEDAFRQAIQKYGV
ncbi:hypothetical protein P9E75_20070, partial [Cytobacillus firmus]|nr:hypothetical protein [Cytobacillus firmus]